VHFPLSCKRKADCRPQGELVKHFSDFDGLAIDVELFAALSIKQAASRNTGLRRSGLSFGAMACLHTVTLGQEGRQCVGHV
jgi:hypothetical protein